MPEGRWLNPPNLLSIGRVGLTPWLIYEILSHDFFSALLILGTAGVSDALDGYFARHFGWTTSVGAYLDPLADKILLTSVYWSLSAAGRIPWWLFGVVIGRDLLILTAAGVFMLLIHQRNFPPSILGKISTAVQIIGAVLILLGRTDDWIIWSIALMTLVSGAGYVLRSAGLARGFSNAD